MSTSNSNESSTRESRAKDAQRRGNFYDGMGFSLLAGLLIVVGLGVFGITSFGWFSLTTAMAMIGLAIGFIALVSFITLMSMRQTLKLVAGQEDLLMQQADDHAALAARLRAETTAAQVQRDRDQDAVVAELTRRQDVSEKSSAIEAEKNRAERDRPDPVHILAQPPSNGVSDPGDADGDPFENGDVYPVQDIEGVAEHFGPLLNEMGIKNTEELWHANTGDVAVALDVSPLVVDHWKCQSELMAVDGIAQQYSEVLVRAGVGSIRELSAQDPERLVERIAHLEDRVENRVQGNTIGTKVAKTWIASAGSHYGSAAAKKAKGTKPKKGGNASAPSATGGA